MAKISSDDLMAAFKEMTLVELSDFVKAFETEFDVTAAAPVAAAAAGGAAAGGAAEAQDEFTLILDDAGSQKIAVIKEVRGINSALGLKEAKDLVDSTPATLIEKGTKEAVEKAQEIVPALFVDIFGDPERNPKGFVSRKMADVVNVVSSVKKPDIADEHSTLCIGSDAIEEATGRLLFRPTVQDVQPKSGKYRFQLNDVLYSKIRPALRKATIADVSGYCSADIYAK